MTPAAWLMLGATWAVVLFFTGRFFWKVLTLPPRPDEEAVDERRSR
jgi:hypothetical protein